MLVSQPVFTHVGFLKQINRHCQDVRRRCREQLEQCWLQQQSVAVQTSQLRHRVRVKPDEVDPQPTHCRTYKNWTISVCFVKRGYVADLYNADGEAVGERLFCFETFWEAYVYARECIDVLLQTAYIEK